MPDALLSLVLSSLDYSYFSDFSFLTDLGNLLPDLAPNFLIGRLVKDLYCRHIICPPPYYYPFNFLIVILSLFCAHCLKKREDLGKFRFDRLEFD